jgi:hypothetical protein
MDIQPTQFVQVPLDGIATKLDIVIESFYLFPSEINVKWTIYGEGFSKTGNIILPQSVIDQWGTDDTIVKNYVLTQLNLIEIL